MKTNGLYFDRFDICEAYYAYAIENHDGMFSRIYGFFGRLAEKGFKPCLSVRRDGYHGLTENGKMIYDGLVERFSK